MKVGTQDTARGSRGLNCPLVSQLQDDDLPGSVAKLDEMLSQELANQKEACDEAAQLLINTIK